MRGSRPQSELTLAIGVGVTTVLAARVSDTATAALTLVNHVASMLFILSRAAGTNVTMVVPQNFDVIDAMRPMALSAQRSVEARG